MKFATALTIGLFAFKTFATPIIIEGSNVFLDSDSLSKFYVVADELNLQRL